MLKVFLYGLALPIEVFGKNPADYPQVDANDNSTILLPSHTGKCEAEVLGRALLTQSFRGGGIGKKQSNRWYAVPWRMLLLASDGERSSILRKLRWALTRRVPKDLHEPEKAYRISIPGLLNPYFYTIGLKCLLERGMVEVVTAQGEDYIVPLPKFAFVSPS